MRRLMEMHEKNNRACMCGTYAENPRPLIKEILGEEMSLIVFAFAYHVYGDGKNYRYLDFLGRCAPINKVIEVISTLQSADLIKVIEVKPA